jgi:hypothetical protein
MGGAGTYNAMGQPKAVCGQLPWLNFPRALLDKALSLHKAVISQPFFFLLAVTLIVMTVFDRVKSSCSTDLYLIRAIDHDVAPKPPHF